ncbi:F-box/kelch-repeat protein At1g57790-like [Papaver somniferum]|uniref:F-box/kelch-repeat protein At1g57790-like n=1 Tax=Papaver somniferum TaxID=3469 RepID=UPI000E6F9C90|nr:F-box/kelch-repeat protein At1g57790-like [Papaver somniferum]
MSKGNSLFFYNPFTKAVIKLPDLPRQDFGYSYRGIAFSSLPTCSDCVVFAIRTYVLDKVHISSIKRGKGKWTIKILDNVYLRPNRTNMRFEPSFNSPIFYDGAFYCLDLNGTLGVFTLENNGTKWEVLSMVPQPNCHSIYSSYLVELEGELLSILLGHSGEWVRCFRLDLAETIWSEVEHLGRQALFISNTSCTAAIARLVKWRTKLIEDTLPYLRSQDILLN